MLDYCLTNSHPLFEQNFHSIFYEPCKLIVGRLSRKTLAYHHILNIFFRGVFLFRFITDSTEISLKLFFTLCLKPLYLVFKTMVCVLYKSQQILPCFYFHKHRKPFPPRNWNSIPILLSNPVT